MREFKFRAWDKKNNMFYHKFAGKDYFTRSESQVAICENGKAFLVDDRDSYEADRSDFIIQQYTGLKDCKGAEIYEGDIIKDCDGYVGIVRYNSLYARFEIKIIKTPARAEWQIDDNFDLSEPNINEAEYQVIGNIYENPELLGGKNE